MMDADPLSQPEPRDYLEPFRVSVHQILTRVNQVLNSFSLFFWAFFFFSLGLCELAHPRNFSGNEILQTI